MVTGRRTGTTDDARAGARDGAGDGTRDRTPADGTTSTPATGVLQVPADRAEASRDASRVLRSMVDARSSSTARDDVHLLVDVVLVASALPDPQTALYAAERLHRVIDALPDEPPGDTGPTQDDAAEGPAS